MTAKRLKTGDMASVTEGSGPVGLTLTGTDAADRLSGMDGNDFLAGGAGGDKLRGAAGNDKLRGEAGNDVIQGGGGNDQVYGGTGVDFIFGGSGNDTLHGDSGPLTARGSDLAGDLLDGGSGNDLLVIGDGLDTVTGGEGADRFLFKQNNPLTPLAAGSGPAFASITDFVAADDTLAFDVAGVLHDYPTANFIDGSAGGANRQPGSFYSGGAAGTAGQSVMVLTETGFASGALAVQAVVADCSTI